MDFNTVLRIARQELVISIRNRWTIIFAFAFGVLVVGVSYFGMMAEGFSGMQNFTRTSASILNLVLYIVPLVALIMGTLSFTGDKGSTELLFAQPVTRGEVLAGKLTGVFFSLVLSTLIGFMLAAVIIVNESGIEGLSRYLLFVLFSIILSLVFLCIATAVAMMSRRKSKAFGISLFLWFFFVILYDLLALGITLLLKGQAANYFLFTSLLGNPVDIVRVASLLSLENAAIFGAAGAALLRFLGGSSLSLMTLLGTLTLWIIVPLAISQRFLGRQDI